MSKGNIGQNVNIYENVFIGKNVIVGNNVTIYPHVSIGNNTRIFDNTVIGRPPISTGNTTRPVDSSFHPLTIGDDCVIGANSVLYTNTKIGKNVLIGDLARIREGCDISDMVVIGGGVQMMYNVKIGARTRIIDGSIITGNMVIEEDVFIGPGVNTINDDNVYLARYKIEPLRIYGPVVRRFALIGTGATLSSGIEIGEGAIVAPNAMVTKDVKSWTVVAGIPAIKRRDVNPKDRELILKRLVRNLS